MNWLQLLIETDREQAPVFEQVLLNAGANAVTLQDSADQPILEPGVGETPLWNGVQLTGLFQADIDTKEVGRHIEQAGPGSEALNLRWEILEDRAWEREWMQHYQPIRCGERLWVCPSWRQPPEPGAVNLMLDPGLAFGTGTHPTTALCLVWLDSIDLTNTTLIDYGCGSGILGIAALLLGARQVVATDNDPQALIATRDNATRNGIASNRIITCTPNNVPTETYDILIANILAKPLIELSARFDCLTHTGSLLCLSGLTIQQTQPVESSYSHQFVFDTAIEEDGWVRLTAVKRP